MEIRQREAGGFPVVEVEGEVDRSTLEPLQRAFDQQVEAGNHRLLVDLRGCSFMDSGGLGTLLALVREVQDRGLVAVLGTTPAIGRLFELTGMVQMRGFALFETEGEALAALASTSPSGA